MKIKAACISSAGRVRSKNEDNFYFDGRCLPQDNNGTAQALSANVSDNDLLCVFDGMGGHEAGEVASFIAASETRACVADGKSNAEPPRRMLNELTLRLNDRVFLCGKLEKQGLPMGTTEVMLKFCGDDVFVCNVGDSPAFRVRDDELTKLSVDHVEMLPHGCKHKPRLMQTLGMDPEEIAIEPSIAKCAMEKGDIYLICSDGLTDMVGAEEICAVLKKYASTKKAAEALLQAAMDNGGKDNITIILCKVG